MSDEIKKEETTEAPKVDVVEKEEKIETTTAPKTDAVKEEKKVTIPAKFKDLILKIEEMSVLDLHELVKVLEEKFEVSAAMVTTQSGNNNGAEAEEEKSEFTVVLTSSGEQKIAVMKAVKEVLGLGLKEAKDLVDAVPSTLKEEMKKVEAEEVKKKIEEAGGKIELK